MKKNHPPAWLFKAYRFVAQAHTGQTVPGTDRPYTEHLKKVYRKVRQYECYQNILTVALLHDVVEDTPVTIDLIEDEFGSDVAVSVLALTKNPFLPKDEQMIDSLERILTCSLIESHIVKMCDRIVNLGPPPPNWSKEKIRKYHIESRYVRWTLDSPTVSLSLRIDFGVALSQYKQYV